MGSASLIYHATIYSNGSCKLHYKIMCCLTYPMLERPDIFNACLDHRVEENPDYSDILKEIVSGLYPALANLR